MDIVKSSILNPAKVIVVVLLILMFGILGLMKLPNQLTPNVAKPEITVRTTWVGATPYEIEREIIEEQEKVLKSIPGLVKYESSSKDNSGSISLEFPIGTDIKSAIIDVTNKLNEVKSYPDNVDRPVIKATGESASPIVWSMVQTLPENNRDIDTYKTYLDNNIIEKLERIDGVAELFYRGGTEKELHVTIDNEKLASYNLTISQVMNVIKSENVDVSAGSMDLSRRSYRIRTASEFDNIDDLKDVVIKSDGVRRVLLTDVADISYGFEKKNSMVMFFGKPGIVIGFRPVPGTNIVELTNKIEKVVNELNDTILKKKELRIIWLKDERKYILGSIDLVKQNIMIGGILAVIVLLLFLRSGTSTAVVALAIPISIIATFIVLQAMGRSLNTISLAGISFAVGMLVDSAIVVLENIDRHRKMGKTIFLAAYDGANEVWGALLASALTTIAVFLPIIFLEDEAGQLFKDIAIAVTASVSFSLFVSISVIPMLWAQLAKFAPKKSTLKESDSSAIVRFGQSINNKIMSTVKLSLKNRVTQAITVGILVTFSYVSVVSLFPKMEYLPQGNKNLVFNILIPPPGFSYDQKKEIGLALFDKYMPYTKESIDGKPQINRLFFVAAGEFMMFGATVKEESRARELIPLFMPGINSFAGVFGISKQSGVFEQGIGKGRTIDVDVSGEDLNKIVQASGAMFGALKGAIKDARIRPVPSIELLYPEVNIIPNRDRLKAVGMSSSDLGLNVDVLMDGRKIADFKEEGQKTIDLVLKSANEKFDSPEKIYHSLIATPSSGLVPISSVADISRDVGISEIRHYNGKKTITLQVTPPNSMTMEEGINIINSKIIPSIKAKGLLNGLEVNLTGTADKLSQTVGSMEVSLILALIITYLLMVALFSNFIYPLVIMFTVPLATAGGFIGLKLTNIFVAPQPLDILTMLGFIILIGIVVNNAILIVHQSLNYIRKEGLEYKEAIIKGTESRLRPIFMSSLTSVFGMLPLVLMPGPGAEFYRGLGSVITGGLALSTLFTLFAIPSLLMFIIKLEDMKGIEDETKEVTVTNDAK
jgi:HAE1 family hydrophobic/amphiphilic exporter-1